MAVKDAKKLVGKKLSPAQNHRYVTKKIRCYLATALNVPF